MEKISQHIRKKFTPVELYMDDIESIVNLMIEAKFSAIKIRTLTHEYSPDELSKITTWAITDIYSYTPFYFSIDFDYNLIHSSKDEVLSEGLVSKLETILRSKKRGLISVITNGTFVSVFWLILISISYIFRERTQDSIYFYLWMIWWLIIFVIWFTSSHLGIYKLSRNTFYFKKSSEYQSFWEKHRDQIYTWIIIWSIATVFTLIITKAFSVLLQ